MVAFISIIAVLIIDVTAMLPSKAPVPEQDTLGGSCVFERMRGSRQNPSCGTGNNDIAEMEILTANKTLIQEGQPGGRLLRPPSSLPSPGTLQPHVLSSLFLPRGVLKSWAGRNLEAGGGREEVKRLGKRTKQREESQRDNNTSCLWSSR